MSENQESKYNPEFENTKLQIQTRAERASEKVRSKAESFLGKLTESTYQDYKEDLGYILSDSNHELRQHYKNWDDKELQELYAVMFGEQHS